MLAIKKPAENYSLHSKLRSNSMMAQKPFTAKHSGLTESKKGGGAARPGSKYSHTIENGSLKHFTSWQDLPSVTPQFRGQAFNTVSGAMRKTMQPETHQRSNSPLRNASLQELESIPKTPLGIRDSQPTDEYGFTTTKSGGFGMDGVASLTFHGRSPGFAARTATTGWNSTTNLASAAALSTNIQSHVSSLIKADSNHDKSTRLFLFLKKQARKQLTNQKDGVSMFESRQD